MGGILDISPGLMFWTLVNFGIFFFLLSKFGWKPMINALQQREQSINEMILRAERAHQEAQKLLEENKKKLAEARQQMMEIVRKGEAQAQAMIEAAMQEAEKMKQKKVEEALRQIEQEKKAALQELRRQAADLVVVTTEKILKDVMTPEMKQKITSAVVEELPKSN